MLPLAQLHPIAVHFPIVFVLTLAAFDAGALAAGASISGRTGLGSISTGLAVLAGLFAVISFVAGDLAYDAAVASGDREATMETHESLGTWTAIVICALSLLRAYGWWAHAKVDGGRKTAVVAVELAVAVMIIATAYFGGQLVYELGVNVTHVG